MTTTYDTEKAISELVAESGGIVKISLGQLRAELGFHRIGKHILARMAKNLADSNMGYFPSGMLDPKGNPEPRQWQEIWVYVRDNSPRSAVLDAIANPEEKDLVTALNMFTENSNWDFSKMDADQRLALIRAAVDVDAKPKRPAAAKRTTAKAATGKASTGKASTAK